MGGGGTPVGGRRDITLATAEAVGRGAACPGGDKSPQRDYTSSGHGGGSYPPTNTTTPADNGRVAATVGLPTAGDASTCSPGLDDVDFGSGAAPCELAGFPPRIDLIFPSSTSKRYSKGS